MTASSAQVRLSVLLAASSDIGVIFRRGPSKRVLAIRWDRADDSFCFGQWFKGRIYENRCDLSPDGEHLLYFAASYKAPFYSWTAVSRPPFLTALALWPKGDCWGGGGEFETSRRIRLNHRAPEMQLADTFALPKAMTVEPFGPHSGRGEDGPIYEHLREKRGWTCTQSGKVRANSRRDAMSYTFDPPEVWSKANPAHDGMSLRASLTGMHMRDGPWLVTTHAVTLSEQVIIDIGDSDWADWDRNGDLLYAQRGSLYRRRRTRASFGAPLNLLDTTGLRSRELAPTIEAGTWHQPLRLHVDHAQGRSRRAR